MDKRDHTTLHSLYYYYRVCVVQVYADIILLRLRDTQYSISTTISHIHIKSCASNKDSSPLDSAFLCLKLCAAHSCPSSHTIHAFGSYLPFGSCSAYIIRLHLFLFINLSVQVFIKNIHWSYQKIGLSIFIKCIFIIWICKHLCHRSNLALLLLSFLHTNKNDVNTVWTLTANAESEWNCKWLVQIQLERLHMHV